MKSNLSSQPQVSPALVESLAKQSSEAGREALAGFLKTLIKMRSEPAAEFSVSTSAPPARWLVQTLENTVNNKITKGE